MCLFTNARTVAIVFARSAGSEALYCAGVLTVDGGFMDSSSSRTRFITIRLKTSRVPQVPASACTPPISGVLSFSALAFLPPFCPQLGMWICVENCFSAHKVVHRDLAVTASDVVHLGPASVFCAILGLPIAVLHRLPQLM